MKKLKVAFFTLMIFFVSAYKVNAECDATESNKLNGLAVNVKASYSEAKKEADMTGEFNPPDGLSEEELKEYKAYITYFKVYITNVTEELYITVYNDVTKETKTYSYGDAVDGTITFDNEDLTVITNYTINVFASDKTGCANKKLTTTYVTTPKFNSYSESALCEGIEKFYLCHKYLSVKSVGYDEFTVMAEKYRQGLIKDDGTTKEEEPKTDNSFLGYIKNHKGVVITSAIVVVVIGGLVTVIIVKKQRSRIV